MDAGGCKIPKMVSKNVLWDLQEGHRKKSKIPYPCLKEIAILGAEAQKGRNEDHWSPV